MNDKYSFNPKGLYVAMVTPMHDDGGLALERIPALIEWYQSQQLQGLFLAGTTGEGRALTQQERCQLLEAVAAEQADLPYIVHVGHESVSVMQELAAHAQDHGAEAVALSPSAFHAISDVDQLLDLYRPVCLAANGLPAMHYHIPVRTQCRIDPAELLSRAQHDLPQLQAVKFTDESLMTLQRCLFVSDHIRVGFGRDEQLLSALAYGCDWAIGSTYNIIAPIYQDLIQAFAQHDVERARNLQYAAVQMVRAMQQCGCGLAAIKIILAELGINCGPVRAPLRMPSADQRQQLLVRFAHIQAHYGDQITC